MRIQPHVWAKTGKSNGLVADVFRNSIVTHGHPHGFCGAIFHALSLEDTIRNRAISAPEVWFNYLDHCMEIPRILETDPQLSTFWLSEWETKSGDTLINSIQKFKDEGYRDIELVRNLNKGSPLECYKELLSELGCLKPELRGSGWKTALAALSLAYFYRESEIEDALITAVNELESDTDTIGTMVGALLGVLSERNPAWPVQDSAYISSEAKRMSRIAAGEKQSSYLYPDLGHWDPPRRQYETIGIFESRPVISGFGEYKPHGDEYQSRIKDIIWQWCELPFGQNILAKRKLGINSKIMPSQLPRQKQTTPAKKITADSSDVSKPTASKKLVENDHVDEVSRTSTILEDDDVSTKTESVDTWTDEVISSKFDDQVLGSMFNRCIETSMSVESAMGFAAIIAKAKLVRMRRKK